MDADQADLQLAQKFFVEAIQIGAAGATKPMGVIAKDAAEPDGGFAFAVAFACSPGAEAEGLCTMAVPGGFHGVESPRKQEVCLRIAVTFSHQPTSTPSSSKIRWRYPAAASSASMASRLRPWAWR